MESGLYSTWELILVKPAVTTHLTIVKLLGIDLPFFLLQI